MILGLPLLALAFSDARAWCADGGVLPPAGEVAQVGFHASQDGCCTPACTQGACCTESCAQPCTKDSVKLKLVVIPEKCTKQVLVPQKAFDVTTKPVEQDVVRCRQVSVCVTDPCTGCTHNECKTETYVEKVKALAIEITPLPMPCGPVYKTVEEVHNNFQVCIEHVQVPVSPCAPAPCAASCSCCGH